MRNKNYKRSTYSKTKEIQNILDTNYFHTKVTIGKDRSILWTVYYINIPSNVCNPTINTKVLTSKNDSIQDIYNLKRKFEFEKNKIFQNNLNEFIDIKKIITTQIHRIKNLHMKLSISLLCPLIFASAINYIKYKNDATGLLLSMLMSVIVAIIVWQQLNMDRYIDKEIAICREKYIKEIIKRQGIWFLNRLRG